MSLSHATANHKLLFHTGTMKWPEEPAKYDSKRFGYKERGVRHPLRLSLASGGDDQSRGTDHSRPSALPLPPSPTHHLDRRGSGGGGSAGPLRPPPAPPPPRSNAIGVGRIRRASSADDGSRGGWKRSSSGGTASQVPNDDSSKVAGPSGRQPAVSHKPLGPVIVGSRDNAKLQRGRPSLQQQQQQRSDAAASSKGAPAAGGDGAGLVTQEQLARILATIGQVSSLTNDPVRILLGDGVTVELKPRAPEPPAATSLQQQEQQQQHARHAATLRDFVRPGDGSNDGGSTTVPPPGAFLYRPAVGDASLGSVALGGLGGKDALRPSPAARDVVSLATHTERKEQALSEPQHNQQQQQQQQVTAAPRSHLSMAEQKRLQWESERRELARLQAERDELSVVRPQAAPATVVSVADHVAAIHQQKQQQQHRHDLTEITRREPAPPATQPPPAERRRSRTPVRAVHQQQQQQQLDAAAAAVAYGANAGGVSSHVEPTFIPGLGILSTPSAPLRQYDDALQAPDVAARLSGSQLAAAATVSLSVVEKKRQQWAREQADALPTYNPWGRPGPGVHPGLPVAAAPPALPPIQHPAAPTTIRPPLAAPAEAVHGFSRASGGIHSGSESNLAVVAKPPAAPPTKAELMKIKWAKERAETSGNEQYEPWGRPGAGAPIRSQSGRVLTDYHSRLNEVLRTSAEKTSQGSMEGSKDRNLGGSIGDSWAARTGDRAVATLAQRQILTAGASGTLPLAYSQRSDSAPILAVAEVGTAAGGASDTGQQPAAGRSHLRGQLAPLDPVTIREREEQRRRQLQHQEEIRRQVMDKQRLQREEAERRAREEAELEQRLADERSRLQAQYDLERDKLRKKELDEQERIAQLKAAMDRAQLAAEAEKAARKLNRLQRAGHDVSQLKATYAEKLTPRIGAAEVEPLLLTSPRTNVAVTETNSTGAGATVSDARLRHQRQPASLPETFVSPHDEAGDGGTAAVSLASAVPLSQPHRLRQAALPPVVQEAYVENRLLTPSQNRARPHHVPALLLAPGTDQLSPLREFGTQTDEGTAAATAVAAPRVGGRRGSDDGDDVAAGYERKARGSKSKGRTTRAEANGGNDEAVAGAAASRKPWGYRNEQRQQYVKQSERDVDLERKRGEEAERRAQRERKMLKLVEANSPRVPAHAASRPTRLRAAPTAGQPADAGRSKVTASRSTASNVGNETALASYSATASSSLTSKPSQPKVSSDATTPRSARATLETVGLRVANGVANGGERFVGDVTERLIITPVDGFLPFTRSDEVLDPVKASEPVPISREPTVNGLARAAYERLMHPAAYGSPLDAVQPRKPDAAAAADIAEGGQFVKAPPSQSLTDSLYVARDSLQRAPASRQEQLMEQLRLMRQGLLQKQKEIEHPLLPEAAIVS